VRCEGQARAEKCLVEKAVTEKQAEVYGQTAGRQAGEWRWQHQNASHAVQSALSRGAACHRPPMFMPAAGGVAGVGQAGARRQAAVLP